MAVHGPSLRQIQNHYDSLNISSPGFTEAQKIAHTERAHNIRHLQVDHKGQVFNYKLNEEEYNLFESYDHLVGIFKHPINHKKAYVWQHGDGGYHYSIEYNPNSPSRVVKHHVGLGHFDVRRKLINQGYHPAEMSEEFLPESNVQKMGRTKLIRIRIRNGKVQRRKRLSNVKGFTFRGGKLTRMSAVERRHRKQGARRAVRKRRAEKSRINRRRRLSMMRRKMYGI